MFFSTLDSGYSINNVEECLWSDFRNKVDSLPMKLCLGFFSSGLLLAVKYLLRDEFLYVIGGADDLGISKDFCWTRVDYSMKRNSLREASPKESSWHRLLSCCSC